MEASGIRAVVVEGAHGKGERVKETHNGESATKKGERDGMVGE